MDAGNADPGLFDNVPRQQRTARMQEHEQDLHHVWLHGAILDVNPDGDPSDTEVADVEAGGLRAAAELNSSDDEWTPGGDRKPAPRKVKVKRTRKRVAPVTTKVRYRLPFPRLCSNLPCPLLSTIILPLLTIDRSHVPSPYLLPSLHSTRHASLSSFRLSSDTAAFVGGMRVSAHALLFPVYSSDCALHAAFLGAQRACLTHKEWDVSETGPPALCPEAAATFGR